MALGINTNVASINAQNELNASKSTKNEALERLSSGLRINSAADDAAGLAISTRFESQISGLNVATRNAQDGISLAQTAEGGLDEITNNLQRVRELSVQAANATNNDTDRSALNDEVQQRLEEIDRIASQTDFNGLNVLDGTLSGQDFQVGANAGQTIGVDLNTSARTGDTGQLAFADSGDLDADNFATFTDAVGDAGADAFSVTVGDGDQIDVSLTLSNDLFDQADGDAAINEQAVFDEVARQVNDQLGNAAYGSFVPDASNDDAAFELRSTEDLTISDSAVTNNPFNGTAGGDFDAATTDAAVDDGSLNEASVDTVANANDAILRVDGALDKINGFRSELGAVQNRFESTITNLNNNVENLEASKSRILDADFASETAKLQKANVLQQAGISVLAQANQSPQQVLSLLQ
ncbi:flagellin [Halomonas sp. 22501_18_FS]|uniref:flagellin N-terminal helical domain-containing protein n=1 Tax=Halomonas sp. 22501_18_FS TaxID=2665505 RepID=UPI00136A3D2A|nr:flagellin [Halomonas sp. 22501_18_FS]MYL73636.1 flagellin [Halomonas sp. 22501_18_FS]MYL73637.1 flagellin [Halomonas sp. 22501_18_FS]